MSLMSQQALLLVKGGAWKFNATFLNASSRAIEVLLKTGQHIGSSLRRFLTKNYC